MKTLLLSLFLVLTVSFVLASKSTALSSGLSQSGGRTTQGNASIRVWVNTKTHVYHCPGTHYYGATKQGEYMTQKQALDAGNRPAYGRHCE